MRYDMVGDTIYQDILRIINNDLVEMNLHCIGSEMLLLALVSLEDSMTSLIFKEMGVRDEHIKEEIKKCYILRNEKTYTSKFNEIIKMSEQLMKENEYVYDEAFLFSILSLEGTVAKEIMKNLGINEEVVLEELNNARELLEKDSHILVNLTKMAREGKLNPFIGRFNYIDKVDRILSKKQKNNPMLIGAAGVGKSGLVEGVAQYYLKKNPKQKIYRLDLGAIIAGTRYRGDLEERLLDAIEEIKAHNAIVFIDEIHNILSPNYNEASLDIANILKPVLSRSEIKCIGATTTEEYYKYIYKDKALARRFQNIFIDEVSDEECFNILQGIKDGYEKFYGITYDDHILKYIIKVSKLITNRKLPDKAIDLLDESGLIAKRNNESCVSEEIIINLIFENISINRLQSLNNLHKINHPELKSIFYNYLNVNSHKNICNIQCKDKDEVITMIKNVFSIQDERIKEIDLNDFLDSHYASNLIGAPSGYVGYDNGGQLTEHLIKYPFAVIVFKNYQDANIVIKNIIKNAINNGYLVDNKNRHLDLKNVIFVFVEEKKYKNVGFIKTKTSTTKLDDFINIIL